jgi:HK97 family phage major capsid protein
MPWLQLKQDHTDAAGKSFKAGDVFTLKKSDPALKALVAAGKAEETASPQKRAINQARERLTEAVKKGLAEEIDRQLDVINKAATEARGRWAPPPGFGPDPLNQAGKTVDADGRPRFNPDGSLQGYPGINSGCGMGKFLIAARDHSGAPTREREEVLTKHFGSKLVDLSNGEVITKASATPLAEASGLTGGYTVPIEYAMRILQLMVQNQVVRPRATIIPMGARSIRIPALDVTTAQSSGVSAFLGGMQMQWTEEAQSKPEFEPQFKQVELVCHELSALTIASNQLLADNAVALDSFLTALFSKSAGWFTDYAYLQGNGSGKPLGILNAPATISVTRATANTFKVVDAVTMLSKLLTTSMGSACWICSQTVIPQLYQLQDAAGRNIFLPNPQAPAGGAAQSPPVTLFGLPIIFTEKLPALGTKGDVMLADASYYLIGDRMQLEIQSSIHRYFEKAQTAWRLITRVDGQPWLDNAVTLADATTTVSPFIVLN